MTTHQAPGIESADSAVTSDFSQAHRRLAKLAGANSGLVNSIGIVLTIFGGLLLFGAFELAGRTFDVGLGVLLVCQAQLFRVRMQLFGVTELLRNAKVMPERG